MGCYMKLLTHKRGRGLCVFRAMSSLDRRLSPMFTIETSDEVETNLETPNHSKSVNHSLLPSTITRILFCCHHNVSPSTAPSYVEDSNPGSLDPESGILPPSHGDSTNHNSTGPPCTTIKRSRGNIIGSNQSV